MAQGKNRPQPQDHLKSHKRKKPLTRKVPVCSNDEVLEALVAAQDNLVDAVEKEQGVDDAKARLEAAQAAVRDETVTYTFRSMGRKAFEALIDEHPPSEDEIKEAADNDEPKPSYSSEDFTVALLAACCIDPVLTIEDTQEIYDDWNQSEIVELFMAALAVNTMRRVVQLGEGSGATNGSI